MYRGREQHVRYKERARSMRQRPTPSEHVMWKLLRNRRLRGLKFRRQHEFLGYIIDFYCAEKRIAIEVDGEAHFVESAGYDLARDETLARWGITVFRVSGREVLHNTAVVERDLGNAIDRALSRRK